MFDESNLHSLIARESRQRDIPHGKLLRESLNAAADEKFTVRAVSGLSPNWREWLRGLAAVAEAQDDWGWWRKPPWSQLKLLLVKEVDYLAWLNGAAGAPIDSGSKQPPSEKQTVKRRRQKFDLAKEAFKAEYPNDISDSDLNAIICKRVGARLSGQGIQVSDDTILRAAGRRKI